MIQQNEPSAYCPFACVPTVDRFANSNSSKGKCHEKSKAFYHMDRDLLFHFSNPLSKSSERRITEVEIV